MENNLENKFAKNAFWIMFGRIFQIVLTFITTMLVTRYLGPTKYGEITYAYSYVALFIPVGVLGLNDIIVKELLDNKEKNGEILGTTIILRTISSIFSIGIIYIVVKNMSDNKILPYLALLQSFSLVFQAYECIMYFYQSKLLAKKTGMIHMISYSVTAIFRIVCLIIKKDIGWFAFAVSLDYIVIAILLVATYFLDGNKLSFSIETAKRLLKKSSPYLFAGIMTVISGKSDSIILGKMIDETTVGYYSAATTLCNAWPFVLTAIIDSASPIIIDLYSKDKDTYKKRIKQLYASIFYIGVVVATIFTIFSKPIITILYGNAYMPASLPLKIASWNTIFSYFGVARFIWMQCENKFHLERLITLVGVIFNLICNYILISNYGIVGAAITLVLTQFIMNFGLLFILKETRPNAKLILDAIMLKDVL